MLKGKGCTDWRGSKTQLRISIFGKSGASNRTFFPLNGFGNNHRTIVNNRSELLTVPLLLAGSPKSPKSCSHGRIAVEP
jgi:hypothetical protein